MQPNTVVHFHADLAEIRVAEWVASGRTGWTHVRDRADVWKFFGFIV
jgi:hypothetical protein